MEQGTVVYAVFQQGVYRHGCAGIFLTLEEAIRAATEAMAEEPDNYHRYEVHPYVLGIRAEEQASVASVAGECPDCRKQGRAFREPGNPLRLDKPCAMHSDFAYLK